MIEHWNYSDLQRKEAEIGIWFFWVFFFTPGSYAQKLLGVGVGGDSRKGIFLVRLLFSKVQGSVNILPERKFTVFVSMRMRKSEDVESFDYCWIPHTTCF